MQSSNSWAPSPRRSLKRCLHRTTMARQTPPERGRKPTSYLSPPTTTITTTTKQEVSQPGAETKLMAGGCYCGTRVAGGRTWYQSLSRVQIWITAITCRWKASAKKNVIFSLWLFFGVSGVLARLVLWDCEAALRGESNEGKISTSKFIVKILTVGSLNHLKANKQVAWPKWLWARPVSCKKGLFGSSFCFLKLGKTFPLWN